MDGKTISTKKIDKSKPFEPTYKQIWIHPEEGEGFRLNESFTEIEKDLDSLDDGLKNVANEIDYVLKNTVLRLDAVKYNINQEKERLQDITMLCNKYTDFDNVVNLKDTDFKGNFEYDKEVFCAETITQRKLLTKVDSVFGNGYEGNKYVYKDSKYLKDSVDTSMRSAISDNSVASFWEYSRITASNTEPYLLNDFNTDSEEAKCTITMTAQEELNEIEIISENEKTLLAGVQYSKNGTDFKHLEIKPATLNSKEELYKDNGYIYGSGKISIPKCKKFKVTLQSKGYTDDTIAFERKLSEEGSSIVKNKTTVLKTGKRHVVKINDITCYSKTFATSNVFTSKELINDKVFSIALFCNMYIPEGLNDAIQFILTVNGVDYEIQPVNSHKNGTKIIRFSQGKSSPKYTQYIGEEIKSATLTVKMKAKNNVTPYLNNIKILLGGEM